MGIAFVRLRGAYGAKAVSTTYHAGVVKKPVFFFRPVRASTGVAGLLGTYVSRLHRIFVAFHAFGAFTGRTLLLRHDGIVENERVAGVGITSADDACTWVALALREITQRSLGHNTQRHPEITRRHSGITRRRSETLPENCSETLGELLGDARENYSETLGELLGDAQETVYPHRWQWRKTVVYRCSLPCERTDFDWKPGFLDRACMRCARRRPSVDARRRA